MFSTSHKVLPCTAKIFCNRVGGPARDFRYFGQQQAILAPRGSFAKAPPTLGLPRKVLPCTAKIFFAIGLVALHVIFAILGSSRLFTGTAEASFCQAPPTLGLPRKVLPRLRATPSATLHRELAKVCT